MTLSPTYSDILQLLDGDTVVFDLNKPSGTGNPPASSPLKTAVGSIDIGTPVPDREFFDDRILVREDYGPVEMTILLHCESSNYEFLREGIGDLARLLKDPKHRIKWSRQTGIASEIRYIHFHSADVEALLDDERALRRAGVIDLQVTIIREPFLRGPEATLFNANVPADPAVTQGMHLTATNPGDARSPAKVLFDYVSGNTAAFVRMASMAFPSPSTFIAGPLFAQTTLTNRGWTQSFGTDTSSISDAAASGGTTAECTFATSPGTFGSRVRLERSSANMESLRGKTFDVWVRIASTVVQDYGLGLHLFDGSGNFLSGPAVPTDPGGVAYRPTSSATQYTWQKIGRVSFPDRTLTATRFDIVANAESSSGRLRFDVMALTPVKNALVGSDNENYLHSGLHYEIDPEEGTLSLLDGATGVLATDSPSGQVVEGEMPLWLEPGENLVTVFYGQRVRLESPLAPLDQLNTVVKVTVTCSPRYLT